MDKAASLRDVTGAGVAGTAAAPLARQRSRRGRLCACGSGGGGGGNASASQARDQRAKFDDVRSLFHLVHKADLQGLMDGVDAAEAAGVAWWDDRGGAGETLPLAAYLHNSDDHDEIARWLIRRHPPLLWSSFVSTDDGSPSVYHGETALHLVIANNDIVEVRWLLEEERRLRRTIPELAAKTGATAPLLSRIADGSFFAFGTTRYYGGTPLSFAVSLNAVDIVHALICDFRANLMHGDSRGNTPAHLAVYHGRIAMFRLLEHYWAAGRGRPAAAAAAGVPLTHLVNNEDFTPIAMAAALQRTRLFFTLWSSERVFAWRWGPVTAHAYPLQHVDPLASRLVQHWRKRERGTWYWRLLLSILCWWCCITCGSCGARASDDEGGDDDVHGGGSGFVDVSDKMGAGQSDARVRSGPVLQAVADGGATARSDHVGGASASARATAVVGDGAASPAGGGGGRDGTPTPSEPHASPAAAAARFQAASGTSPVSASPTTTAVVTVLDSPRASARVSARDAAMAQGSHSRMAHRHGSGGAAPVAAAVPTLRVGSASLPGAIASVPRSRFSAGSGGTGSGGTGSGGTGSGGSGSGGVGSGGVGVRHAGRRPHLPPISVPRHARGLVTTGELDSDDEVEGAPSGEAHSAAGMGSSALTAGPSSGPSPAGTTRSLFPHAAARGSLEPTGPRDRVTPTSTTSIATGAARRHVFTFSPLPENRAVDMFAPAPAVTAVPGGDASVPAAAAMPHGGPHHRGPPHPTALPVITDGSGSGSGGAVDSSRDCDVTAGDMPRRRSVSAMLPVPSDSSVVQAGDEGSGGRLSASVMERGRRGSGVRASIAAAGGAVDWPAESSLLFLGTSLAGEGTLPAAHWSSAVLSSSQSTARTGPSLGAAAPDEHHAAAGDGAGTTTMPPRQGTGLAWSDSSSEGGGAAGAAAMGADGVPAASLAAAPAPDGEASGRPHSAASNAAAAGAGHVVDEEQSLPLPAGPAAASRPRSSRDSHRAVPPTPPTLPPPLVVLPVHLSAGTISAPIAAAGGRGAGATTPAAAATPPDLPPRLLIDPSVLTMSELGSPPLRPVMPLPAQGQQRRLPPAAAAGGRRGSAGSEAGRVSPSLATAAIVTRRIAAHAFDTPALSPPTASPDEGGGAAHGVGAAHLAHHPAATQQPRHAVHGASEVGGGGEHTRRASASVAEGAGEPDRVRRGSAGGQLRVNAHASVGAHPLGHHGPLSGEGTRGGGGTLLRPSTTLLAQRRVVSDGAEGIGLRPTPQHAHMQVHGLGVRGNTLAELLDGSMRDIQGYDGAISPPGGAAALPVAGGARATLDTSSGALHGATGVLSSQDAPPGSAWYRGDVARQGDAADVGAGAGVGAEASSKVRFAVPSMPALPLASTLQGGSGVPPGPQPATVRGAETARGSRSRTTVTVVGRTRTALEAIVDGERFDLLMDRRLLTLLDRKWTSYARAAFVGRGLLTLGFLLTFLAMSNAQLALPNDRRVFSCPAGANESLCRTASITEVLTLVLVALRGALDVARARQLGLRRMFIEARGATLMYHWLSAMTGAAVVVAFILNTRHGADYSRVPFSFAACMGWLSLLYFLLLLPSTGQFIIILVRVVTGDVARFLVLLAVLFFAFSHAMLPLADVDPRFNDRIAFLSLMRLLTKLLLQPDLEPESDIDRFWVLPTVAFAVLCSILAVNVLIATLSETVSRISDAAAAQYTLERARIVLAMEADLPTWLLDLPCTRYWSVSMDAEGNERLLISLESETDNACVNQITREQLRRRFEEFGMELPVDEYEGPGTSDDDTDDDDAEPHGALPASRARQATWGATWPVYVYRAGDVIEQARQTTTELPTRVGNANGPEAAVEAGAAMLEAMRASGLAPAPAGGLRRRSVPTVIRRTSVRPSGMTSPAPGFRNSSMSRRVVAGARMPRGPSLVAHVMPPASETGGSGRFGSGAMGGSRVLS